MVPRCWEKALSCAALDLPALVDPFNLGFANPGGKTPDLIPPSGGPPISALQPNAAIFVPANAPARHPGCALCILNALNAAFSGAGALATASAGRPCYIYFFDKALVTYS